MSGADSSVDASRELRLCLGGRRRAPGRLDHATGSPDVALDELAAALAAHSRRAEVLLCGGEPTLRADLPRLIATLVPMAPRLGMLTDGLALSASGVAPALAASGLGRVRVELHAARPEVHDWLCGIPGAGRLAVRGIRASVAAGLRVECETVVTRPSAPYLAETVAVLGRLGVAAVHLRRLTARGAAADDFIALSPRFGLVEDELAAALAAGRRASVEIVARDFPACVAPALRHAGVELLTVAGVTAASGATCERGCAACPGAPACEGAPADYVARFGHAELRSAGVAALELARGAACPPSPRAGRAPATRLGFAVLRASSPAESPADAPRPIPPVQRFAFYTPARVRCADCGDHDRGPRAPEATRAIRARLVRAAQEGSPTLRIGAASLAHPAAAALLWEATRLSWERVEVAGEAAALDSATDGELVKLRKLARFDVALFGPDAARHDEHTGASGSFARALSAAERLHGLAGVPVGAYAVIHDAAAVEDWAAAWAAGRLPGAPAFRLAERGGTLDELARAAAGLPDGAARRALAAVLPRCRFELADDVAAPPEPLLAWGDEPERWRAACGSDPYGRFDRCACPRPGCVGLAAGWTVGAAGRCA
jgi:MoaA/NifB/PqqE/SkfB family radical SAM enzyme